MNKVEEKTKPRSTQDEEDLKLIHKMKEMADKGFNVEFKKDTRNGTYKALRVDKRIITTE